MYTRPNYDLRGFLLWTRRDIFLHLALSLGITIAFELLGWRWLNLPWAPLALVGTAIAFLVSLKNNASYARVWEARQIWGSIVNVSRTWAMLVLDAIPTPTPTSSPERAQAARRRLIYRHLAWLTALRFQLRAPRSWENMEKPYNREYLRFYKIPERESSLEAELGALLTAADCERVLRASNRATRLAADQSAELRGLAEQGQIDSYTFIALERVLQDLVEQQGKCERIKSFPYPRQFATANLFFVRLFVVLIPLCMVQEFSGLGQHMVWLNIPFSGLVAWVFTSMERIGESTENPFEGSPNDVPITTLCRTIEIDLRELLGETTIPAPLQPENGIAM